MGELAKELSDMKHLISTERIQICRMVAELKVSDGRLEIIEAILGRFIERNVKDETAIS